MECAEDAYFELIEEDIKPQMARSVLPTCLKTEIVMTAPMYEFEHFFNLRMLGTAGIPHPMIKELSEMAYTSIKEVYYGTDKN
jgi:thymidylate synthase (FAD)